MSITILEDTRVDIHRHQRGIRFEGREPEAYESYTHKGKQWIPDYAFAKWEHGRPIEDISLRGVLLKKDGTPGQVRVDITYQTSDARYFSEKYSRLAPKWLVDLFADSPHTTEEAGK